MEGVITIVRYSPYKPREIFLNEVPRDFLEALTRAIREAYEESYDHCTSRFGELQSHDVLPHHRRATIERNILQCVQRFPYAKAETRPNYRGNCFHVVIKCGHVVLTVSSVKSSGQMVRESIFRKTYARDAQLSMFVDEEFVDELQHNLYAVLLHKPHELHENKPEFMMVQFPNSSLTKYLDNAVNLWLPDTGSVEEYIKKPVVSGLKIKKKVGNDVE